MSDYTPKRHERGQWIVSWTRRELSALIVCYAIVWVPIVLMLIVCTMNDTQWAALTHALASTAARG